MLNRFAAGDFDAAVAAQTNDAPTVLRLMFVVENQIRDDCIGTRLDSARMHF